MSLSENIRLGLAFVSSLALSAVLTPLARVVARRLQLVAKPKEDRWHRRPTALLGGPAIVLSSVAAFLITSDLKSPRLFVGWLGGAAIIAVVGVLDDIIHFRPVSKLIAQIVAALIPISLGLTIPVFHPLASFWISLFWIVGITNAFNLLDNMDGLAAGIGVIAAAVLCIHALRAGNAALAVAAAGVSGAALGFLIYNFQPASIFMGDEAASSWVFRSERFP
ncbi:MAG TPA: MraY family glycosyltransferase [Thermoanaerobaculia bacterium]|nr:MraY family glycosyltransferase [Thermoanaerobaculia bacterium]